MKTNKILFVIFCTISLFTEGKKILHLTFHRGCAHEIEYIGKKLNLDVTTWFIPDLPQYFFDNKTSGSALYNIGHARAERIWNKHKDFFNQFDAIITSDTAPLSRIFLQNNFQKPLIVWICNRFDYADCASLDCNFPDKEYYDLLNKATQLKNIRFICYTPFEYTYAQSKKVNISKEVIKPSGFYESKPYESSIPSSINKSETFFIPPYHNDKLLKVHEKCTLLGIKTYRGRYNGPEDLKEFKGIIHIPYSWSNLALFENWQSGLIYFIPSLRFFTYLRKNVSGFFVPNANFLEKYTHLTEWYNPIHKDLFVFFDSWKDLKEKIEKTDWNEKRQSIFKFSQNHLKTTLEKWKSLFDLFARS